MSDIVQYLKEEKQITPTSSGAREFIEEVEEIIRDSEGDRLEFRELIAVLIFSSVSEDETAWRLMGYRHDVEREEKLIEELQEMEDIDRDKELRVRIIAEIVRRLKESELQTSRGDEG